MAKKKIFIVEQFEWSKGGSDIKLFPTKKTAMNSIKKLLEEPVKWRHYNQDKEALDSWHSHIRNKSIKLKESSV